MADFIKVTTTENIPNNSIKPFLVGSDHVAIANLNGQFYAIADVCTHDGGPLGEGTVVGECCVECPRHGARFDLKTGAVKALPASMPVKTYEIKVEGSNLFIKL